MPWQRETERSKTCRGLATKRDDHGLQTEKYNTRRSEETWPRPPCKHGRRHRHTQWKKDATTRQHVTDRYTPKHRPGRGITLNQKDAWGERDLLEPVALPKKLGSSMSTPAKSTPVRPPSNNRGSITTTDNTETAQQQTSATNHNQMMSLGAPGQHATIRRCR